MIMAVGLLAVLEVGVLLGLGLWFVRLQARVRGLDDHATKVVEQVHEWVQEVEALNSTVVTLLQERVPQQMDDQERTLPEPPGETEPMVAMPAAVPYVAPTLASRTQRLTPLTIVPATPEQAQADTTVARQLGMDPVGVAIQRQLLARMAAARTT